MTTTSTHETEITVDPNVPLVRITRAFDAPPTKVFRAHTDPELVVQWLGPRGHEMRIDHYDCRTRLTATSLVDSFEDRDAFVASGMEEGVREGYERLDELLAG